MVHDLSYLSCPLPEDIERLIYAGNFERALSVIEKRIYDKKVPNILKQRLAFEKSVIAQYPLSYPHDEKTAFRMLQDAIEGITRDETEAYRDDGSIDWIYREGNVYYKDNFLQSLIKTHPDLAPRLKDQAQAAEANSSAAFLNDTIAQMKRVGHMRVRIQLHTTLTIEKPAQRPGEHIRVYMPLPIKDAQCMPISVSAPGATLIADETHPQRTACFDVCYSPDQAFETDVVYEMDAPYVKPDPAAVLPEQPHFDTEEMLPQIRFTPMIRALAAELKGDETNPLLIARRFYDYVTCNAVYRFVPPYFMKTCIPEYFAAGLHGDCGMHALLFITLCRCVGIPAKWQAGLVVRPGHVGNHDWAMFYVAPYGWLWADGSFGGSAYRSGDEARRDFYFGNLDPYRLVANTDLQQEFDPPMRNMRADPYDNQSGEVEYDDRALRREEFNTSWEVLSCEIQ